VERLDSKVKAEAGVGPSSSSSLPLPALPTPPLPPPDSRPQPHADSGMASSSGSATHDRVNDKVNDMANDVKPQGAWWDSTNTSKANPSSSREFGDNLDSSDEASARRPSGTHSATAAGEPSRQNVPFVLVVQEGPLFGDKKAGMFSPRSTHRSGTRAAVEHPSDVIEKTDQSWADMDDDDDTKQNQNDGDPTCVLHVTQGSHSDVGNCEAVDIQASVDARNKTQSWNIAKQKGEKARTTRTKD
jgi:hypothetical protein